MLFKKNANKPPNKQKTQHIHAQNQATNKQKTPNQRKNPTNTKRKQQKNPPKQTKKQTNQPTTKSQTTYLLLESCHLLAEFCQAAS